MNYSEAIDYLYNVAPLFQNIGQGAYKEGLANTQELDAHFGHPHLSYRTIHVAGTNGKGSVSHTLAAILQSAGYKVGLYTSPHLLDFRERIRVNGEMIPEQRVVDFVEQERAFFEPLYPSFFELTTALAFLYFKEQQVDFAVIEVGLGGRLDCTNIIRPELSIITNISYDHTQFLGDTLEKIAREKAGIIKRGVPVVVGETNGNDSVHQVFLDKAQAMDSPIVFADEEEPYPSDLEVELKGFCQTKNTQTIWVALKTLKSLETLKNLSPQAIREGFSKVCELTGLMGRWQKIQENPTVICDTGHNPGGLQYIAEQLRTIQNSKFKIQNKSFGKNEDANNAQPNCELCIKNYELRIVLGMAGDKDIRSSLSLLPKNAVYYFTQATVKRALPADKMAELGCELGLVGRAYPSVSEAYRSALQEASANDMIYVGGSTFIVADLLQYLKSVES